MHGTTWDVPNAAGALGETITAANAAGGQDLMMAGARHELPLLHEAAPAKAVRPISMNAVKPQPTWRQVVWPEVARGIFPLHGWLVTYWSSDNHPEYSTGTLVGPKHVLTCGHAIYNPHYNPPWPNAVRFVPGRYNDQSPCGMFTGVRCIREKDYQGAANDFDHDIGMVILGSSPGLGNLGLAAFTDDNEVRQLDLHIAGYPHASDFNGAKPAQITDPQGRVMWTDAGKATGVTQKQIQHKMDIWIGHSGAGIWVAKNNTTYVIAVQCGHSTTTGTVNGLNYATRITPDYYQEIRGWITSNP